ncbi:unnamed protein product, partial [Ilex paraguariensis]
MIEITTIGVVGGGQMGSGIAQVAAVHGLDVWLHDTDADALTRAQNQYPLIFSGSSPNVNSLRS